jgi:hypothetical protein
MKRATGFFLWLGTGIVLIFNNGFSAGLPTAMDVARQMGVAWNIGNSLEVPKDPLAWGNPLPTKKLIDLAKSSGFGTIRIPCAWDSHADQSTNTINAAWLTQVKTIVDYCISSNMYVVLNSHWDGGWLEESITPSKQTDVNKKQKAYWTQIANYFKNYDHHLLFAGANEPAVQDPYGTAFGPDRVAVLNSYLQTFIDAVRETGGNNATRTLIIQGPHADIELAKSAWTTLPKDNVNGRLMTELHFYPFQWALMENDADWGKVFYYWGKENLSTTDKERNTTWCDEAFVDSEFTILKRMYVDKEMPVLLGEFGAMKRVSLSGDAQNRHLKSRLTYYQYVVSAALAHGIVPAAWDAGGMGDKTMTIFNRTNATVFDSDLLNAIMQGAKTEFNSALSIDQPHASVEKTVVHVTQQSGIVTAKWFTQKTGNTLLSLIGLQGRIVWSGIVATNIGMNCFRIPSVMSGMGVVRVEQGGQCVTEKVTIFDR